jgi:hypothetical protein
MQVLCGTDQRLAGYMDAAAALFETAMLQSNHCLDVSSQVDWDKGLSDKYSERHDFSKY